MKLRSGTPTIDRERLRKTFGALSGPGSTDRGGLHRLALTDADRDARRRLARLCQEAGFEVVVDRIGSMFATRQGSDFNRPPLLIGSHLDSQPYGGRYDGVVGVATALEVLRSLDDLGIVTRGPVQLVNWTNEEGARFQPPLIASGVFAGVYDLEFALSRADVAGVTIGAELSRIGFDGRQAPGWPLAGYIEVHIEQGTVLERAGAPIGIVTGVVGIRDIVVRVMGEDTHAGPLEMHLRRDALVGAARMIIGAQAIGLAAAPDARVTVGRISVPSDSHSVVPGLAEFVVDLRHPDDDGLEKLDAEIRRSFRALAEEARLDVSFETMWQYPSCAFAPQIRDAISAAAAERGLRTLDLPSRAGHDAWNIARVARAGMIFIPCRNGVSHNEAEHAEFEHIAGSADVLLGAVIRLAG